MILLLCLMILYFAESASAVNATFGTSGAIGVDFQTNGITAMTVDTSQQVGIGVTVPGADLDIQGASTASSIALKVTTGAVATGQALVVSGGTTATAANTVQITGSSAATGAAAIITAGANGGKALVINSAAAPTADIVDIQKNGTSTFKVDYKGHLSATNTTTIPTVACAGGTGSLAAGSNDIRGTVVLNAGASACTLTFGTPYTSVPTCVLTSVNVGSRAALTAVSATAFTGSVQTAGTDFLYFCLQ